MKLAPIPKSRAKTAWGLIQDVKKAILAEPKRIDMTDVVYERDPGERGPACGTVGCFAGWVCLLKDGRERTLYPSNFGNLSSRGYAALDRARAILGDLQYDTVGTGDERDEVFNDGGGDKCELTKPGTKAHAKAVVVRINKFMRVNSKALKAKRV